MSAPQPFDRGVAVISIDTEQIWGHFDLMSEPQFEARYGNTRDVHDRLLNLLSAARIGATWAVVGALALKRCQGASDERMAGLPPYWTKRIPAGDERTQPLWYAPSLVFRILRARTPQEIGLHGGLTHLIWGDRRVTAWVAERELNAGKAALQQLGIQPACFVFPRDLEAHHAVLRDGGIRCYRGRAPILSERMGFNIAGSLARASEEILKLAPPVVWPNEELTGLWNLPASMSLYCLGENRCNFVPARLRVERTKLGLEAAARHKGVFHLAMHPENLAESGFAFSVFESIVEEVCRRRDRGDIEALTMNGAIERVAGVRRESAFS